MCRTCIRDLAEFHTHLWGHIRFVWSVASTNWVVIRTRPPRCRTAQAVAQFNDVIKRFKESEEATLAQNYIKQINSQ